MEENKKGSCLKILHFFDMEAKKFHLNFFGEEYYSTTIGSILSILSILIVICFSVYIYVNLFIDNYIFTGFAIENSQASINLRGRPIMFGLANNTDFTIPIEQYDLEVSLSFFKLEISSLSGGSPKLINTSIIKLEKCNKKYFFDYPDFLPEFSLNEFLCLPLSQNISLYGNKDLNDNQYSQLNIKINRCINDSCLNTEYSQFSLKMAYLSYGIDYKNNTQTYYTKMELHSIPFSINLIRTYDYYLEPIIFEIDYGYGMSITKQEKFYSFHHFESISDLPSNEHKSLLGAVNLNCTRHIFHYKKIYRRALEFVTHVVSHLYIFLIILKFLNYIFTRKLMTLDILNHYFEKVNPDCHTNKVSQDPNHSEIKLNPLPNNINNIKFFRASTLKKPNPK
jgi:hypothetical protein